MATALRIPIGKEPFSPSPSFSQTDWILRHPWRDDGPATGSAVLSLEVDRGPDHLNLKKHLKVENLCVSSESHLHSCSSWLPLPVSFALMLLCSILWLSSIPPPTTNCSLCKQNRPSFQDDRPHWKASASGDDSHFDYVHDQNQKNLGGKQSVMYRDKVMTALWETEASYSHSPS